MGAAQKMPGVLDRRGQALALGGVSLTGANLALDTEEGIDSTESWAGVGCAPYPDPMQTVAQLREACARLARSEETFPFGPDTLVWKVGGKVYALSDISADPLTLSLKVRSARGDELRAAHAATVPGYHLNKRHWITATLDSSVPDALIGELLSGSHALVVAGLTRAARAELGLSSSEP